MQNCPTGQRKALLYAESVPIMYNIQGTSEAALFSLSGGERIPKKTAVLLGMVPLTFDVIVRVLGNAFVFLFAPIVGGIGVVGKFLTTYATAHITLPSVKVSGYPSHPVGQASAGLSLIAGIITPIFYSEAFVVTKSSLKKHYAINRTCMSSILLIEISTVLALITNANVHESSSAYFRMPTEVDEQVLDCTNICPAVNETNRNLTLTENFTTLENLTNLTDSGNNTEFADACLSYVPISQSDFITLAIILMVLALYTIIESILMMCKIRTLSDCLLFDQGDLPDKVLSKIIWVTLKCCWYVFRPTNWIYSEKQLVNGDDDNYNCPMNMVNILISSSPVVQWSKSQSCRLPAQGDHDDYENDHNGDWWFLIPILPDIATPKELTLLMTWGWKWAWLWCYGRGIGKVVKSKSKRGFWRLFLQKGQHHWGWCGCWWHWWL